MCTQKISEWITLKRFCCLVPLKEGTYISGFFLLVYCLYVEIQTIFAVFWILENIDETYNTTYDQISMGSGVPALDAAFRASVTADTVLSLNFIVGLMIAWAVINGVLIVSTSLMIFGAVKRKAIFLLQFLVISISIFIGNVGNIMVSFGYIIVISPYETVKREVLELVFVILENVMLAYAFLVVRSYYCIIKLPAVPISFKTLEGQENDSESGEG